MSNNIFSRILGRHAVWLNGLSSFSNKISRKHYNKQNTPPRDKELRLLTKIIAVSIVSTGLIISLGGG